MLKAAYWKHDQYLNFIFPIGLFGLVIATMWFPLPPSTNFALDVYGSKIWFKKPIAEQLFLLNAILIDSQILIGDLWSVIYDS